MAAETDTLKFKIDKDEYEIPPLDDFDMDEWQIVYDYSGLVLEDFAPAPDRAEETGDEDGPLEKERQRRVNNPAFTSALLHIGYRRAKPDAKPDAIKKLVGSTKRLQVLEAMAEAAPEGDAVPPGVTPALAPPSLPESGVSSEPESNGSTKNSDELADRRATIGISE